MIAVGVVVTISLLRRLRGVASVPVRYHFLPLGGCTNRTLRGYLKHAGSLKDGDQFDGSRQKVDFFQSGLPLQGDMTTSSLTRRSLSPEDGATFRGLA